jgi:ketosteroid isomerase-like protein
MPGPEDKVQSLADRAEIYDVLTSYFRAIDALDREAVLNVYADDASLAVHGRHVATGREEIEAFLANWPEPAPGVDVAWGGERVTHHLMGAPSISVDGDTAATETYAIVHVAKGDPAQGGEIMVRALRYVDKFRRTENGWRINDRLHVADLGMSGPGLFATTFADRQMRPAP